MINNYFGEKREESIVWTLWAKKWLELWVRWVKNFTFACQMMALAAHKLTNTWIEVIQHEIPCLARDLVGCCANWLIILLKLQNLWIKWKIKWRGQHSWFLRRRKIKWKTKLSKMKRGCSWLQRRRLLGGERDRWASKFGS
jgi:hypothetical protein